MQGKEIKAILSTITTESMTDGSMGDLWSELPDFIRGSDWVSEIADMASTAADWIGDDDEVSDDLANDLSHNLGNYEVEDYYSTINRRVQALSLWAYPELDDEVVQLSGGQQGSQTLTDLNSLYLYAAMRGLAYQILTYAFTKAGENDLCDECGEVHDNDIEVIA